MKFICTIPGRAYVKKNGQRAYGNGGHKRIVYSPKYLAWEVVAILAILEAKKSYGLNNFPIKENVNLCARFYFKDRQAEPDLSALFEGIADCLQKTGAIVNDRQIFSFNGSTKIFDGNPRTEIELTLLEAI